MHYVKHDSHIQANNRKQNCVCENKNGINSELYNEFCTFNDGVALKKVSHKIRKIIN